MREILEKLKKGKISVKEAERLLKLTAIEQLGTMAKIDVNRDIRKGVPEVILAEGKTPKDTAEIALKTLSKKGRVIISRVDNKHVEATRKVTPKGAVLKLHPKAALLVIKKRSFKTEKTGGKIGILAAGTSDIPVAEEARVIAEEMGCEVTTAHDVGVAGIHRLFPSLQKMVKKDVDVIITVAGREGALPSVVAGMVDVPIIAVPTSIGYGLGEKGISSLTAMLQACSLGLAVVNIDGGVAAGSVAALIANRVAKAKMP